MLDPFREERDSWAVRLTWAEDCRDFGICDVGEVDRIPDRTTLVDGPPERGGKRPITVVNNAAIIDAPAVGWIGMFAPETEIQSIEGENPTSRAPGTVAEMEIVVPAGRVFITLRDLPGDRLNRIEIDPNVFGPVDDVTGCSQNTERIL